MEFYREIKTTRKDGGNEIIRSLVITEVNHFYEDDSCITVTALSRKNDEDVLLSLDRKIIDRKKQQEKKKRHIHVDFLIKKEDFPKILEILCPSKKGRRR